MFNAIKITIFIFILVLNIFSQNTKFNLNDLNFCFHFGLSENNIRINTQGGKNNNSSLINWEKFYSKNFIGDVSGMIGVHYKKLHFHVYLLASFLNKNKNITIFGNYENKIYNPLC